MSVQNGLFTSEAVSSRHPVRLDEYRPSRRRSRPTSPGSVHRSASSRIRTLYAALNRRRLGWSITSASGGAAALRLPSSGSGAFPFSFIRSRCPCIVGSLPSPYSNSLHVPCLTYVGREGSRRSTCRGGSPRVSRAGSGRTGTGKAPAHFMLVRCESTSSVG